MRQRPGNQLERLLNEARESRSSGFDPQWDAEEVQRRIVAGELGPERMCDTKARFAQYDHAENAARDLREKYGNELLPYPCPFCAGFHLHTAHT